VLVFYYCVGEWIGTYRLSMRCVVVDSKESPCHIGEAGLPLELTPLQTITAALSLTAQLVSLLACYLDVILLQRLDYRWSANSAMRLLVFDWHSYPELFLLGQVSQKVSPKGREAVYSPEPKI